MDNGHGDDIISALRQGKGACMQFPLSWCQKTTPTYLNVLAGISQVDLDNF